ESTAYPRVLICNPKSSERINELASRLEIARLDDCVEVITQEGVFLRQPFALQMPQGIVIERVKNVGDKVSDRVEVVVEFAGLPRVGPHCGNPPRNIGEAPAQCHSVPVTGITGNDGLA